MSSDTARYRGEITMPIQKLDEDQRLVTGVVLEPLKVDSQGHFEKAETIQKAAHRFLARFGRPVVGTRLGLQHQTFGDIGVELVESYIAPVNLKFDDGPVEKGSWVMVVKILDDDVWKGVKDGEITGFSIGALVTIAADPD